MYTLAVEDIVEVPVKFTLKSGNAPKLFAFTFLAKRLDQDQLNARLADKGSIVKDFMADIVTGWQDQTLVLGPGGQPADFSPDTLKVMLNAPGVAVVFFNAYLKDCGAKEKN